MNPLAEIRNACLEMLKEAFPGKAVVISRITYEIKGYYNDPSDHEIFVKWVANSIHSKEIVFSTKNFTRESAKSHILSELSEQLKKYKEVKS